MRGVHIQANNFIDRGTTTTATSSLMYDIGYWSSSGYHSSGFFESNSTNISGRRARLTGGSLHSPTHMSIAIHDDFTLLDGKIKAGQSTYVSVGGALRASRSKISSDGVASISGNNLSFESSDVRGAKGLDVRAEKSLEASDSKLSSSQGSVTLESNGTIHTAHLEVTAKKDLHSSAKGEQSIHDSTFKAEGTLSASGETLSISKSVVEGKKAADLKGKKRVGIQSTIIKSENGSIDLSSNGATSIVGSKVTAKTDIHSSATGDQLIQDSILRGGKWVSIAGYNVFLADSSIDAPLGVHFEACNHLNIADTNARSGHGPLSAVAKSAKVRNSRFAAQDDIHLTTTGNQDIQESSFKAGRWIFIAGHDVSVAGSHLSGTEGAHAEARNHLNIANTDARSSRGSISVGTKSAKVRNSRFAAQGDIHLTTTGNQDIQGSSFNAGRWVFIAGHDVSVAGSHLSGTEGVHAEARNYLNIAGTNARSRKGSISAEAKSAKVRNSCFAAQGDIHLTTTGNQDIQGSSFNAGRWVFVAGHDVSIAGSHLSGSAGVHAEARNHLNIANTDARSSRGSISVGAKSAKVRNSRFTARDDIHLTTTGNQAIQGSNFRAGRWVFISGHDASVVGSNLSGAAGVHFDVQNHLKVANTDATSSRGSVIGKAKSAKVTDSHFTARDNVYLETTGNQDIQGSSFKAGRWVFISGHDASVVGSNLSGAAGVHFDVQNHLKVANTDATSSRGSVIGKAKSAKVTDSHFTAREHVYLETTGNQDIQGSSFKAGKWVFIAGHNVSLTGTSIEGPNTSINGVQQSSEEQESRGRSRERTNSGERSQSPTPRLKDTFYEKGVAFVESIINNIAQVIDVPMQIMDSSAQDVRTFVSHVVHDITGSQRLGQNAGDLVYQRMSPVKAIEQLSVVGELIDAPMQVIRTDVRHIVRDVTGNQRLGQNAGDLVYVGLNVLGPKGLGALKVGKGVRGATIIPGKLSSGPKISKAANKSRSAVKLNTTSSAQKSGPSIKKGRQEIKPPVPPRPKVPANSNVRAPQLPNVGAEFGRRPQTAEGHLSARKTAAPAPRIIPNPVNQNRGEIPAAKLKGPYDPHQMRADLEAVYGKDKITSTTLPKQGARGTKYKNAEHPDTSVVYDNRGLPNFEKDLKYEMKLSPEKFYGRDRTSHMRAATRQLRQDIAEGKVSANEFTPEQLQKINAGKPKIEGYTWHHHQNPGRMQLIEKTTHERTAHIGSVGMEKSK